MIFKCQSINECFRLGLFQVPKLLLELKKTWSLTFELDYYGIPKEINITVRLLLLPFILTFHPMEE